MSFFSEETESQLSSHTLWAEKYRPSNVEDYICDNHLKDILNEFIKRKDIPHLLFHGGAGTGKCLAYEESIDIEMEVTNGEYEILKKYEIH